MSSTSMTPDKGYPRENIVEMTSSLFQKDLIYPREGNEAHGTKPHHEGSYNFHTNISHGEKYIQVYEDMEELSNKEKWDAKYS